MPFDLSQLSALWDAYALSVESMLQPALPYLPHLIKAVLFVLGIYVVANIYNIVRFATYILLVVFVYLPFFILGQFIAGWLVNHTEFRAGWVNNKERWNDGPVLEPYLKPWLSWFCTYDDNSLWGDTGWRQEHCPVPFISKEGMKLWLQRNCAYGLSWHPLGAPIKQEKLVRNGPGSYDMGFFFQRRKTWVAPWDKTKLIYLDFGWVLDAYYQRKVTEPKACFKFEPRIVANVPENVER